MAGEIFLLFLVLAWVVIGPIIALVQIGLARSRGQQQQRELERLKRQVDSLMIELWRREPSGAVPPPARAPATRPVEAPQADWGPPPAAAAVAPCAGPVDLGQPARATGGAGVLPEASFNPFDPEDPPGGQLAVPPPLPSPVEHEPGLAALPSEPAEPAAPFSLEHFMGVKLFAWLGGLALFFGIIFFVKYAFENNLISKEVRVALGFVTGTGLLVGGLLLHRRAAYLVLAHSFCATGVLILYGVSFAAHAVYHFALFNTGATFALMALITVAAFLVAVRLNALVVAVLGMLGGFITPVLLHTGHDQLLGLFGYIALLVMGLTAVSRYRNWSFLVTAAAIGTALMQYGWFMEYFAIGQYDVGTKTLLPMGILLFFNALFATVAWLASRRGDPSPHAVGSALGMAGVSLVFAFAMLAFAGVSVRLPVLFGFLLLQNLVVLGVVWIQPRFTVAQVANALLTFLLLAVWTGEYLNPTNLIAALVVYLVFGALHAVAPVFLARLAPSAESPVPLRVWPWAAPLTLLLLMFPIVTLPEPSLLVWPAALLMIFLTIVLAANTGSLLSVLGALGITLALAIHWLFKVPMQLGSLPPFLGITLGFAAVFSLAGHWFAGKPELAAAATPPGLPGFDRQVVAALPVLSGMLPFGLLMLAILRLPIAEPTPVFGVGLLLVILLLGLAVLNGRAAHGGSFDDPAPDAETNGGGPNARATGDPGMLPATSLLPATNEANPLGQMALVAAAFAGMFAVQALWHGVAFNPETPAIPLTWDLGCYALFLAFPFVFRRPCESQLWPWITAAVAGIGYFLLVHNAVQRSFPAMAERMGLLPCGFAIPSLAALVIVVRMAVTLDPVKRSQLAWFGGVALFFITLIFPIQFDREWLTVSWALEGALLLWLFRRVPHPGLQLTGLGLLAVAFVRLVLNPAVFVEYPRSGTAIFNWHLYTYGIVAAAQFFAARWFTDPAQRWQGIPIRGILYGLGGVLLFLLLNLEIADYFTPPRQRVLSFGSGVNFQRDMTYSIAWGLFALGLLVLGIWYQARPARYAAIGLLALTLLKVFIHDLSSLASVFRIGALIGVAVIAFIASFLYQQFFNRSKSP